MTPVGLQFKTQLNALANQHLHHIEAELRARGLVIHSRHIKFSVLFSGYWEVQLNRRKFRLKISTTGNSLVPDLPDWHELPKHVQHSKDFDALLRELQKLTT